MGPGIHRWERTSWLDFEELHSYGLYSNGLYSWGLYSYGLQEYTGLADFQELCNGSLYSYGV